MRTKATTVVGCLHLAVVTVVAAVGCSRPTSSSQETAPPSPQNWVELAVHNFGAPINTKWAEGELSFADDGTMVLTSSREDLAIAPGDPKDLYIATFNGDTGKWNVPLVFAAGCGRGMAGACESGPADQHGGVRIPLHGRPGR